MNAQAYILIGLGFSVFALLAVQLWAGRPEAAARRRLKRSSPSNDVLRQWAAYRPMPVVFRRERRIELIEPYKDRLEEAP